MARREVTAKKLRAFTTDNPDTFTIAEFCKRHRISPQLFYKFKDRMPVTFRIGARVLISKESAARWRAEREGAAQERRRERSEAAAATSPA